MQQQTLGDEYLNQLLKKFSAFRGTRKSTYIQRHLSETCFVVLSCPSLLSRTQALKLDALTNYCWGRISVSEALLSLQYVRSQWSQVALRSTRGCPDNDGLIWGRVHWVGLLHVPAGRTARRHGPHQRSPGLSCLDHRYMELQAVPVLTKSSQAFTVSDMSIVPKTWQPKVLKR
jgi:hypothetical protein